MSSASVLLLTAASSASSSHSRRSSVSASVTIPGSPGLGVATRNRGSLPGPKSRGLGGIGGGLGEVEGLVVALGAIGEHKGMPDAELSVRAVTSSPYAPPARAPAVVLVPLEEHDSLTTPSAICFVSPMGSSWSRPDPASAPAAPRRARPVSSIELSGTASATAVERVVAHVKRVISELAGTNIPVIAYTPSTTPLPPQIAYTLKSAGCVGVLSPPFTPDSVRAELTKVSPWSKSRSAPQALTKPLEPISDPLVVPPTPVRPSPAKPSLSLASLPAASTSYQTQPLSASSHMSTLPSLAPLVPPPPHLAARASYSCPHIYAPALPPCARRRSVDVGGLALALSGVAGHGSGWGGWAGAEDELALGVPSKGKAKPNISAPKRNYGDLGGHGEAMYAELLSQMYTQTGAAVDGATSDGSPSPPTHPYPTGRPHSASDPHIPFAYNVDESATPTPVTSPNPDAATPKSSYPDDVDPVRREELIKLLDRWEFEPHKLADADVLACASLLFEAAFEVEGMEEEAGVRFDQIPPFLRAVRKIYRTQNQYHNFQHALDVFQAVYWFLCRAGVVPPVKILAQARKPNGVYTNGSKPAEEKESQGGKLINGLGQLPRMAGGTKWRRTRVKGRIGVLRNVDVFALLLAAVGHDVGHPGLSNAFMTNADTPLSKVFDHKSSLEQLHCALLLRLMHKYGMGHLLSSRPAPSSIRPSSGVAMGGTGASLGVGMSTGRIGLMSYASSPGLAATYQSQQQQQQRAARGFRWLLVQTVLATDMSVHFEWLKNFKEYAASGVGLGADGFGGMSEDEERLMICQALIKCGDISNPTRPHAVSEHWSKVLLEEWACQATFEQELDLPVTVVKVDVTNGARQQAQGQVNFIDIFTQPLFDTTAAVISELHPITEQCSLNRKLWHERMERLAVSQESSQKPAPSPLRPRTASQTQEAHYRSIFPLSLPPALTQSQSLNQVPTLASQGQSLTGPLSTRPSSATSASTVGATSLFSPTGSTSSVSVSNGVGPGVVGNINGGTEPSALRAAYQTSVRKKKSFHRVSWPVPVPPPPPLPVPSPLGEH